MAEPALAPWTLDQFFAWQERQEDRYELVNGLPVKMMAGASNAHVAVSLNIIVSLANQLRGKPCRPFHGDGAVRTKFGNIRRPDIGVDCGPFIPNGYLASAPAMVAEVLSPSTRDFDTFRKVEEYKLIPTLRRILLIDPNRVDIGMWIRGADGEWEHARIEGMAAEIFMPKIGVTLALTEIYDGLPMPAEDIGIAGE